MLPPNQRELYLSALRPPPGFHLDRAIGSTYSLDLITLLSLPLSFALLAMTNDEGKLIRDPVALLHALRTYANRLTIFCQAGGIAVPAQRHPLYAYLEDVIIPVRKVGGAFHPKIWLLRFISPGEPVHYRFLCLSRNITGDPSWDTLLALDGQVTDRQRAFAKNHPLADFLEALPNLAADPVEKRHRRTVKLLSDEVRRVRFDLPEPFVDYEFHPMGLPGFRAPELPEGTRRLLVLSPFLSAPFLKEIAKEVPTTLISRAESLDTIDVAILKKFEKVYAIDESASGDDEASESLKISAPLATPPDDPAVQPAHGLHAKLYLADVGWDSDLWTGSANATSAGFHRNVEFLTRLTGKKSKVGIDAFLNGVSGSKGFSQFLSPYQIPKSPPVAKHMAEENARLAEELRSIIAALPLRFEIALEGKLYRLSLRSLVPAPNKIDATAVAWPITLNQSVAQSMSPLFAGKVVDFGGLSSQALSGFLAVMTQAPLGWWCPALLPKPAPLWRKIFFKFVRDVFPFLGVWRGIVLDRNIRPSLGVLGIDTQPLLDPRLGIRLDRIYRAFRLANPAVNALIGVNDEHVLTLVEAVYWTHFDAVHVFALDAALVDDVGQLASFQQIAEVNSFTTCAITVPVHWLEMDAQKTYVLWLNRNTEEQAFTGRRGRVRQVAAEVRAVLAITDPPMLTTRS
jgi:hypothetical protein